jgi:hypothetical protein
MLDVLAGGMQILAGSVPINNIETPTRRHEAHIVAGPSPTSATIDVCTFWTVLTAICQMSMVASWDCLVTAAGKAALGSRSHALRD